MMKKKRTSKISAFIISFMLVLVMIPSGAAGLESSTANELNADSISSTANELNADSISSTTSESSEASDASTVKEPSTTSESSITNEQSATNESGATNESSAASEPSSFDATTATNLNVTPEDIVGAMTLEQKIGQMIMPAFRTWTEADTAAKGDSGSGTQTTNVTEMNDAIAGAVSSYGLGGVILFSENIKTTAQTATLVNDFQKAATSESSLSGIPMLISTDQEGGSVCRLNCGTCFSGNMALAANGSLNDTETVADLMGKELSSLGINVDFAPVMDVNNNPANPVIGVRSFSDRPEIVAKFGKVFIRGLQNQNIACALKHFPGHGDTDTDSHTGLPCVNKTYAEIKACELIPFYAGISADSKKNSKTATGSVDLSAEPSADLSTADSTDTTRTATGETASTQQASGADIVMSAHIQYPQIETGTYTSIKDGSKINLPATLSEKIITGILRNDMGYDGVVSTDALNMSAIAENFDPQDAARLAINAGVDILLMPVTITDSIGVEELGEYIDGIASQVRSGAISEDRITESALRIIKLKEKRGILNTSTENLDDRIAAAEKTLRSDSTLDTEMKVTKKAITLLKTESSTLPFNCEKKTAIFCPYSNEVESFRYGVDLLAKSGKFGAEPQVGIYCYRNKNAVDFAGEIEEADQIAVSVESSGSAAYTGWQSQFTDELIQAAHDAGKKVLFISTQLPYDAARYQQADAIMLTYSPKGVSGLTTGPNFAASVLIAFGEAKPTGKLPVDIFELDENYQYTDEILYSYGSGMTDFRKPAVKVNVKGTLKLKKGRTYKKVRAYGLITGDRVVKWSSSKKRIVSVSSKGVLKAKKRGTAVITVRTKQGAKASFKVKVR